MLIIIYQGLQSSNKLLSTVAQKSTKLFNVFLRNNWVLGIKLPKEAHYSHLIAGEEDLTECLYSLFIVLEDIGLQPVFQIAEHIL